MFRATCLIHRCTLLFRIQRRDLHALFFTHENRFSVQLQRHNLNERLFNFVSEFKITGYQHDQYLAAVMPKENSIVKIDGIMQPSCSDNKVHICGGCNKQFRLYRSLQSHKSNDCCRTYICPYCNKTYSYRASFCRHRKRCMALQNL